MLAKGKTHPGEVKNHLGLSHTVGLENAGKVKINLGAITNQLEYRKNSMGTVKIDFCIVTEFCKIISGKSTNSGTTASVQ